MMHRPQLYTTLNNGVKMPLLGIGVYDMYRQEAEQAVLWALETGYRLIDTAAMYQNEAEIGQAVQQSGIARQDIFITTKVHDNDQGYDKTLKAFDTSLKKLNCDYIDLYLVHWPLRATRKDTWQALERLYTEGVVRAIGVANYLLPFLNELETYANLVPAVNQVEFSPFLYLKDLHDYCQKNNIQLQAYTPLMRGQKLDDPRLVAIAQKHGKTSAQIVLRWALEHGVSTIPKSANWHRIRENFDVFDFNLSPEDKVVLDNLNQNFRMVEDPMDWW
ncbi:MAG: aldo/keto reductase [Saprospiraceae bacterium]|nr:aldo/keto reductase [Saprospiraceae bacterium]